MDLGLGDPGLVEADPAAPDHHALVGVGVGQRLQQDGVDDGEDGAVGADPEGEGENGGGREAGRAREGAGAAAGILPERVEKPHADLRPDLTANGGWPLPSASSGGMTDETLIIPGLHDSTVRSARQPASLLSLVNVVRLASLVSLVTE